MPTVHSPAISTYDDLGSYSLSASSASVTLTNFNQAYKDLIIVYTGVATGQNHRAYFNGDAQARYHFTYMLQFGTSEFAGSGHSQSYANLVTQFDNQDSSYIMQIHDFSSTDKHKTFSIQSQDGDYSNYIGIGRWANVDALESITFFMGSGNIPTGANYRLYGIKG